MGFSVACFFGFDDLVESDWADSDFVILIKTAYVTLSPMNTGI